MPSSSFISLILPDNDDIGILYCVQGSHKGFDICSSHARSFCVTSWYSTCCPFIASCQLKLQFWTTFKKVKVLSCMYIIAKDRKKVVLHSHPLTPSKSLILRTFKSSFFLMNTFTYLVFFCKWDKFWKWFSNTVTQHWYEHSAMGERIESSLLFADALPWEEEEDDDDVVWNARGLFANRTPLPATVLWCRSLRSSAHHEDGFITYWRAQLFFFWSMCRAYTT